MQHYKILHRTYYRFSGPVTLGPHALLLRPREDHALRIESSALNIIPSASLRWHLDVEGNSVAVATFDSPTDRLAIESEVVVQQYNETPLDFLVADYAVAWPFTYRTDDTVLLSPYLTIRRAEDGALVNDWIKTILPSMARLQTYSLLHRICAHINQTLSYTIREEPGVQTADETLSNRSGSCRDFAVLFMEAAKSLGIAARFVSGYLHAPPSPVNFGATHAWAEVYLPGAGWKGFDPTIGNIVGSDHIAVAVASMPESISPISGTFFGTPGTRLDVGVWVTKF